MKTEAQSIFDEIIATAYENIQTHLKLFATTGKQKYYDAAQELLSHAKTLSACDTTRLDALFDRQAAIDRQAKDLAKTV